MSFARFSSDDYRSDVYVYIDAATDKFAVHVASGRHDVDLSDVPPKVSYTEPFDIFAEQWAVRHMMVMEKIRNSTFIPYEHEYAGNSYTGLDVEETVEFLKELEKLGYHIPAGTIDAVAEVVEEDITS